jgi:quercetin dioxygenase-like cupin family protein
MSSPQFNIVERPGIADPSICIVHAREGQRVPPELAELLDPVEPATFHEYVLPAGTEVKLHRHDFDENWWFTCGSPVVTLWTETSGPMEFQLKPGDLVACLRGVAHTLRASEPLDYFQYCSYQRPGAREGHLTEGVPDIS